MSRGYYGGGGGGGGVTPEQLEDGLALKVGLEEFTEKGVILVGANVATLEALESGPNGTSLIADSDEPSGLRWESTALFGNLLAWTGTDYAPTSLKADTSKPRIFVGPVDPETVGGVVLNSADWFDTWVGGS